MKVYRKVIFLDYPINPLPRYGYGNQPHLGLYKLLEGNRHTYLEMLKKMEQCEVELSKIHPEKVDNNNSPYWNNGYVEELDAASLFSFVYLYKPNTYLEVGSGNSTKFVKKAILDYSLGTKIVSIDPTPRAEINDICDLVIRKPLEEIDLKIFYDLKENDILMIDGSHRCFQNSDVTITFLEILPKLNSGVIVYIDDIFLPYDYPPELIMRFYSEQYLLAVLLLNGQDRYEAIFPCTFMSKNKSLKTAVKTFWNRIGIQGIRGCGNGLWLRIK